MERVTVAGTIVRVIRPPDAEPGHAELWWSKELHTYVLEVCQTAELREGYELRHIERGIAMLDEKRR